MLQMGIQPEEERKNDMGESVFPETDPISLFLGFLIYHFLYIGMNTESRRGQQTWPLSQSGASYKIIQRFSGFDIIFWPWDLLTFYGLSDTGQLTRKLIVPGVIFSLNQAPPSK